MQLHSPSTSPNGLVDGSQKLGDARDKKRSDWIIILILAFVVLVLTGPFLIFGDNSQYNFSIRQFLGLIVGALAGVAVIVLLLLLARFSARQAGLK